MRGSIWGSDRPGHLFAAVGVGVLVIIAGGCVSSPWLAGVGLVCMGWEWLCTPDVDVAWKRKPDGIFWALVCLIWLPYSWIVPHRDRWSHSLLFGLPARLGYVLALVLGISWACGLPGVLNWFVGEAWSLAAAGHYGSALALAGDRWGLVLTGCALGDLVHLLKDNYHGSKILFGRN